MNEVSITGKLAARWTKIESAFDCPEQQNGVDIQQLTSGIEANPDAEDILKIFDQGVSSVVPDLFNLVAGEEVALGKGRMMSHYRILRLLGSGGMGEVYLAERADGQYEKQVALKIMSADMNSAELLNRFHREIQILAELNHPGIATLLDAGIADDGRPWFVTDYIKGKNLTDFCSEYHLGRRATIKLFVQVCKAVHFAHEHGVVHRDLKPENILVQGEVGNAAPIVLDFGIASRQQQGDLTRMGNLLGTPAYSSPEQVAGNLQHLDRRSDIFSLGILLYELIDKRRPFDGASNTETSYNILHQDTPPLSVSRLSPDLSSIIFKCLYKAPAERYSTVQELITDLENYLAGCSVAANPVGLAFRIKRRALRYPLISLAVGVVFLVMVFLSATSVWQGVSKHNFASHQAEIAQYYTQSSQYIVSGMNLIYSRPLHNIEKEIQRLDQRYRDLLAGLNDVDVATMPVVKYALGNAALSIGKFEQARDFLTSAWEAGLQEPLLALKLGQTYLQLYEASLQRLSYFSSYEARKNAYEKYRLTYLQPAKVFMGQGSRADHEDAIIATAMEYYWEDDQETALRLLQQAGDRATWPVTAVIASGNIYLELGEKSEFKGDLPQAYKYYQKSSQVFEQAADIARSHPLAIKGHCVATIKMIQTGSYQELQLANESVGAISSCDTLTFLEPGNPDFLILAGQGYVDIASAQLVHGENPERALVKARKLADTALGITSTHPGALHLLAEAQLTKSKWIYESGGDGEKEIIATMQAFEQAVAFSPGDLSLQLDYVQALKQIARVEYLNGREGDLAYRKAAAILQQVIAQPDASPNLWLKYADLLAWQGYYLYTNGRDAEPVLQRAVRYATRAKAAMPDSIDVTKSLAMAVWTYADFQYFKDEDPARLAGQAFDLYQSVIDADPKNCTARFNQLGALSLIVDYALEKHRSQEVKLEKMFSLITELKQCLTEDREASLVLADYWRYRSKQTLLDDGNPDSDFRLARKYLSAALKSKIDRYEAVQSFGYQVTFEHQWRTKHLSWDQKRYQSDVHLLSQAIADYPDLPILRAMRGRLMLLGAKTPEQIARAGKDLSSALHDNALLRYRFGKDLAQWKTRQDLFDSSVP